MRLKKGFTILELLIVIAILAVLVIMLLAALDPFEQLKKGTDTAMLNTANEAYGAMIRYVGSAGRAPWSIEILGAVLSSGQGLDAIEKAVSSGELKRDFVTLAGTRLMGLFMTAASDGTKLAVCFLPVSKSFRTSPGAVYDRFGNRQTCPPGSCYICVGKGTGVTGGSSSGTSGGGTGGYHTLVSGPDDGSCEGFNPEYPAYPMTCNVSNQFARWGCTNYCVIDMGCPHEWQYSPDPNACPPGQRLLIKSYTSGRADECLDHQLEAIEKYCVSGPTAHCAELPYPASDMDYEWGCTSPRRPKKWK